jgi:hypothetical protein
VAGGSPTGTRRVRTRGWALGCFSERYSIPWMARCSWGGVLHFWNRVFGLDPVRVSQYAGCGGSRVAPVALGQPARRRSGPDEVSLPSPDSDLVHVPLASHIAAKVQAGGTSKESQPDWPVAGTKRASPSGLRNASDHPQGLLRGSIRHLGATGPTTCAVAGPGVSSRNASGG